MTRYRQGTNSLRTVPLQLTEANNCSRSPFDDVKGKFPTNIFFALNSMQFKAQW